MRWHGPVGAGRPFLAKATVVTNTPDRPGRARARKLKVFQAQFGFYDTVVAAPSRAAARRIWGVRQNVFADGTAIETTDEAARAAALARPETVLKRPVGSTGPFELDPAALPEFPPGPSRKPAAPKLGLRKTARAKLGPAKAPDRTPLTEAEAALRRLDEARKAEEKRFEKRQGELDAEKRASEAAYEQARNAAGAAVAKARRAYRAAGGRH